MRTSEQGSRPEHDRDLGTTSLHGKLSALREMMRNLGGCVVAFSGGVDSSLLLAVAREQLGDRCMALTVRSAFHPEYETSAAVEWLEARDIPYEILDVDELSDPLLRNNPPDRCYVCKKKMLSLAGDIARAKGFEHVVEGSNGDDGLTGRRPGLKAVDECGALSPLRSCGLGKSEIRLIAQRVFDLPQADRPSTACLATRFPYGTVLEHDTLAKVARLEHLFLGAGAGNCRVRVHGDLVRLELEADVLRTFPGSELCDRFGTLCRELGFRYVTLDLSGFRSGSMDESLEGGKEGEARAGQ